jgi:hypothetical protein
MKNNSAWRMTDFAIAMAVSSTLFEHKIIHIETWRSPDGATSNQSNHVMTDSCHTTDILDVKSCRGVDCDSHHFTVKIKYRQRISVIGKSKAQRCSKEYKTKVEDLLETLPDAESQNVETAWENIKQAICKVGENTLGCNAKKVRNGWYDEECKEELEVQNYACLNMLQRKQEVISKSMRMDARKEARKVCRRKKTLYDEELEELQEKYKRNDVTKFYEGIRKIRKGFQPRTTMCRNKQRIMVRD